MVSLILKKKGFKTAERMLSGMRFGQSSFQDQADCLVRARQTARLVKMAAQASGSRASPLDQAITLWWMLGLSGVETSIKAGIYEQAGETVALAWVLLGEEVLIGEADALDANPLVDIRFDRR